MGAIQRRVFVSGIVQGVGFRAATIRAAAGHGGLRGFVRNLRDGRVEAVFQGDEAPVLAMVEWCRQGPRGARVKDVVVQEEAPDEAMPSFGLRADA